MARRWLPIAVGVAWLTACGAGQEGVPSVAEPAAASEETTTTSSSPPTTTTPPATTVTPRSTSTTSQPEPVFVATVHTVGAEELGVSWRPGCPVGVEDLRLVELTHWDDRGEIAIGELVVHVDHVDDISHVFERIFEARFPIHSMRLITAFDADDDASMQANNTSAFNCREINGRPGVWSQHAFGGAIDINPLVNPWVRGSRVDPPEGAAFVDRDPAVPGLIVAGDAVTSAFADVGWGWGGEWTTTLDYQHFSHDGR